MTTTLRWLKGTFQELSPTECREMLAQKDVGRVGFWSEDGPNVLPVTYVMDGDGVSFRTSPYSSLAQVGGAVVAFEVDETDSFTQSGWSVMIRGVAEVHLGHVDGPDPDPWPEGVRSVRFRVRPGQLTGRRVLPH